MKARLPSPKSVLIAALLFLSLLGVSLLVGCKTGHVVSYDYFDRRGMLCDFNGGYDLHQDKNGWHYTHPFVDPALVSEVRDLEMLWHMEQYRKGKTP